jgi:adenylate cyclase
LKEPWKFHIGDHPLWKSPDFDDRLWPFFFISKRWTQEAYPGQGIAWYRYTFFIQNETSSPLALWFPSVSSALEIYWDGVLLGNKGTPAIQASQEVIGGGYSVFFIPSDLLKPETRHVLSLRLSNHIHSSGCIYGIPRLGTDQAIFKYYFWGMLEDVLILGIFFTSFIYHIFIFFGRRKEWNYLYFACLTLSLFVYIVCNSQATEILGQSTFLYHLKIRLEYLAVPLAALFNLLFLVQQFERYSLRFLKLYFIVSVLFLNLILWTPPLFFTGLLTLIHVYLLLGIILSFFVLFSSRHFSTAHIIITAFLLFSFTIIIDIYLKYLSHDQYRLMRYGFCLYILALSISLAQKFNDSLYQLEKLTQKLQERNRIFQLFVPKRYVDRIAKGDMNSIRVGNAEEAIITTLFTDIRGFTTFAEANTPRGVFLFLNEYFNNMSNCIEKYEGFIDKYIGDAIMAVFDSPNVEGAVAAAIQMRLALDQFNQKRKENNLPPIEMGIGLNTGKVIMGTVGSESRMDSTVIGDSVNLSARLESLTKDYHVSILISGFTYQRLENKAPQGVRRIDRVCVKGKNQEVDLFEIFAADPLEIRRQKQEGLPEWESALVLYFAKQWNLALSAFQEYHQHYPLDQTCRYFIENCQSAENF